MLLQLEPDVNFCSDVTPAVVLVAVCRVSDRAILAQKADRTASEEELRGFEDALAQLMRQASELPAHPGWTERLSVSSMDQQQDRLLASDDVEAGGGGGYVYALADSQALCVVAVGLRSQQCPERVAHELVEGLAQNVRAVETERRLIKAKPGGLTAKTKRMLREVIRSYSDPDKVNKVNEVYEKFDRFKSLLHTNVARTLEAHIHMETLQTQGQSMSVQAENFLKESICKRRQGEKQSIRTKLVAGGSVLAVLALLLVPLAFR